MLGNASDWSSGAVLQADVCIVGAGAAGITLARELSRRRLGVCLLESGALTLEGMTQSLYEGTGGGDILPPQSDYVKMSRLRYFGGTTNCWGGWCRPLDEIDFESRPWVPDSGWPFSKAALVPFYERACEVCGIPPFRYDEEKLSRLKRRPVSFGEGSEFSTEIFHQSYQSYPVRFGEQYREELTLSKDLKAILYGNVTHLQLSPDGRHVLHVDAKTLNGSSLRVRAKYFVLATGGLENARLLLTSRDIQKQGIGNGHDLVGRYFMEHPHLTVGRICLWRPPRDWRLYTHFEKDESVGARLHGVLHLKESAQRREEILGSTFTLLSLDEPLAGSETSYQSYRVVRRSHFYPPSQFPPAGDPAYTSGYEAYRREVDAFKGVAHLAGETFEGAKMESSFLGLLFARCEQAPSPDSRVTLTEERDALGMPKLHLNWKVGPKDTESLMKTVSLLAAELGSRGLGRIELFGDDFTTWPTIGGGCHHMGTTRMHRDPKKGVVDVDGRVHGIGNLFVAGSSVFPTGGYVNPTLTVVALAIRLADHLGGLASA